jgi:hypothetical protein
LHSTPVNPGESPVGPPGEIKPMYIQSVADTLKSAFLGSRPQGHHRK